MTGSNIANGVTDEMLRIGCGACVVAFVGGLAGGMATLFVLWMYFRSLWGDAALADSRAVVGGSAGRVGAMGGA